MFLWKYKLGFGGLAQHTIDGVTLVYEDCANAPKYKHVVDCIDHDPKLGLQYYLGDIQHITSGQSVGLVHTGSEVCDNDWLKPHLLNPPSFHIRFLFLVYGTSAQFDATPPTLSDLPPIFHWPLGPAYARGVRRDNDLDPVANGAPMQARRKYMCNFVGTLHERVPARGLVVDMLNSPQYAHWNCYTSARDKFPKKESAESMDAFAGVLRDSDFTLCPSGGNAESYRIYESMILGAVPILERDVTHDKTYSRYHCQYTYQFLKDLNPPVVWLDNWSELPAVMEALLKETPEQMYQRR